MRCFPTTKCFLAIFACCLALAPVQAATWQIDPAHSSIGFTIRHLMITNVKGTFGTFSGTIDYDGKDSTKASVQATIATSSIDTGIEARDKHLRSADFFDVEKYPTMSFVSTKIEPASEKTARIVGTLTLHGVTKPVTLDAEMLGSVKDPNFGTRMGFTASTALNRKDFGLTWNKLLEAGGVAVGDEVKVHLEIEAVQPPAEKSSGKQSKPAKTDPKRGPRARR